MRHNDLIIQVINFITCECLPAFLVEQLLSNRQRFINRKEVFYTRLATQLIRFFVNKYNFKKN